MLLLRLVCLLSLLCLCFQGVGARQHDAWDLGLVSSDDFTNADVRYEQSFANIKRSLTRTGARPQEIPIVTGFLARGENTGGFVCVCLLYVTVQSFV